MVAMKTYKARGLDWILKCLHCDKTKVIDDLYIATTVPAKWDKCCGAIMELGSKPGKSTDA